MVELSPEEFKTVKVNVNGIESNDELNSTVGSFKIKNSEKIIISIQNNIDGYFLTVETKSFNSYPKSIYIQCEIKLCDILSLHGFN